MAEDSVRRNARRPALKALAARHSLVSTDAIPVKIPVDEFLPGVSQRERDGLRRGSLGEVALDAPVGLLAGNAGEQDQPAAAALQAGRQPAPGNEKPFERGDERTQRHLEPAQLHRRFLSDRLDERQFLAAVETDDRRRDLSAGGRIGLVLPRIELPQRGEVGADRIREPCGEAREFLARMVDRRGDDHAPAPVVVHDGQTHERVNREGLDDEGQGEAVQQLLPAERAGARTRLDRAPKRRRAEQQREADPECDEARAEPAARESRHAGETERDRTKPEPPPRVHQCAPSRDCAFRRPRQFMTPRGWRPIRVRRRAAIRFCVGRRDPPPRIGPMMFVPSASVKRPKRFGRRTAGARGAAASGQSSCRVGRNRISLTSTSSGWLIAKATMRAKELAGIALAS